MNRLDVFRRWTWSILVVSAFAFAMGGCSGDDGRDGAQGPAGPQGPTGPEGPAAPTPDFVQAAVDSAQIESCGTCHSGVGGGHQQIYDSYVDASRLAMTFTDVTSNANGDGTFTVTADFSVTFDGMPVTNLTDDTVYEQLRFYAVRYDSVAGQYLQGNERLGTVIAGAAPGDWVASAASVPFDPTVDGQVYGYIARGILFEHDSPTSEAVSGTHVHLYDDVANAAMAFGDAAVGDPDAYVSAANVEACETCHGDPYLKHGFRAAKVDGLPDFGACKSCHYDTRDGSHEDWQYMVDDPYNWATDALDDITVETKYAYLAKLKNDVHMSHAMEFPYPQSMANCATCHGEVEDENGVAIPGSDKLSVVLADEYFTPETCFSCHPVEGNGAWHDLPDIAEDVPDPNGIYAQEARAKPMLQIWTERGVEIFDFHNRTEDCTNCHKAEIDGGFAPTFAELHTGYDARIYDPTGIKYADVYTVAVGNVTYDDVNSTLTVEFSGDPAIEPTLYVSFYGWDTKDFLVSSHFRDTNRERYEYQPESSGGNPHPLFTEDAASVPGAWIVTADLTAYAPDPALMNDIPTLIADGDVTKVEVTVAPTLSVDGLPVGLTAMSKTFDLGTKSEVSNYFQGSGAIVDYKNCNVCHDQLAVTFHYDRGRAGEITVCRNCHASTNPGSHLEMQSRSIEGYVHAIHSFQDFDPGDTFAEFDPVDAKRYDQHIKHTFPNFTIRNCEACHNPGTYNVPDQSKSMPGGLSASDDVATWYGFEDTTNFLGEATVEDASGRKIGGIPEYVVGPASKACGGCHRADMIAGDAAGELASFNAHTDAFGTLVKNDTEDDEGNPIDDEILFGIINKIMTMFE